MGDGLTPLMPRSWRMCAEKDSPGCSSTREMNWESMRNVEAIGRGQEDADTGMGLTVISTWEKSAGKPRFSGSWSIVSIPNELTTKVSNAGARRHNMQDRCRRHRWIDAISHGELATADTCTSLR